MLRKIKEWFHISQRRKKHKKIEVLETVRPFSKDEGFILYPLDDEPNKHMYGNGQWIKANPDETMNEVIDDDGSEFDSVGLEWDMVVED